MIKVCDAIMGTGKSSAAITYMNEHPNENTQECRSCLFTLSQ